MTPDPLSAIAGVVLSLVFSYVPGASDWYGALSGTLKRLVMIGLCLLVALVQFALSCTQLAQAFGLTVTCDQSGAVYLVNAFIAALVANQAAYLVSPRK